jgi:hypothetical protein
MWLVALLPVVACSEGKLDSGARSFPIDSSPAWGAAQPGTGGQELVPAEWTVFEDTSRAGEVMTASLQLPAAKDIEGLLDGEGPRLILRCVDGQVEASIETEGQTARIQLDSAPACE